jgi:hypothetical protein
MSEPLEGWCTDPYEVHEARWLSDGSPTPLVRDGQTEGHDPAPEGPFKVTPVPIEHDEGDSSDLLRADDAERESTRESPVQAAWDTFGGTGSGGRVP